MFTFGLRGDVATEISFKPTTNWLALPRCDRFPFLQIGGHAAFPDFAPTTNI
jgi:hypothetical protein